jgi:hypothetical protein
MANLYLILPFCIHLFKMLRVIWNILYVRILLK